LVTLIEGDGNLGPLQVLEADRPYCHDLPGGELLLPPCDLWGSPPSDLWAYYLAWHFWPTLGLHLETPAISYNPESYISSRGGKCRSHQQNLQTLSARAGTQSYCIKAALRWPWGCCAFSSCHCFWRCRVDLTDSITYPSWHLYYRGSPSRPRHTCWRWLVSPDTS
jgi:hypothetical protein